MRSSTVPLRPLLVLLLPLGCGTPEDSNPFGQNPTATMTAPSTMSGASTEASTGSSGSGSSGSVPTTGASSSSATGLTTSATGVDSSTTATSSTDATSATGVDSSTTDATSGTGVDSSSTGTTAPMTTDAPATCGDGKLDPGEACDDGNMVEDDGCTNCQIGPCVPSGQRAPFNTLSMSNVTGDWKGNPCDNDEYQHGASDTQCFGGLGESFACSGPSTCVSHVGITTYWSDQICQGIWEVLCDGKVVQQISTMNKVCNTSAMNGPCTIAFGQQICSTIELRAVEDGMFGAGSCCANAKPDSSIGSVSVW